MSSEENKAVVRRYFDEVIDGGNRFVMTELFVDGAPQHFPGRTIVFNADKPGAGRHQSMHTSLHHLVAEDDFVVAHLTHRVTFLGPADFQTSAGNVDISNRSLEWDAMAVFRLEDGKIAEEWVNRDELSILVQLNAVTLNTAG